MTPANFYLGTHHPHWLGLAKVGVPLFVSRRSLMKRKSFPRAVAPWALDSGGFTELQIHGQWTVSAADYAREVRRYSDEIGKLDFAAPQDWMCEPDIIKGKWHPDPRKRFVGTKLSVAEHQRRTIANYLELLELAPDLPWMPVLQGWSIADYWHHVEAYARAGVDLASLPRVGVGTVCRRQDTPQAHAIMGSLHGEGLRLHAFGFKLTGLRSSAPYITSADSLAWSQNARRNPPIPGHTHEHCSGCIEWAMTWREDALGAVC
jgi:hypothetical protein